MSNRDGQKPGPAAQPPVELRTDEPHPARVYDYLLGGKDNFRADREAADRSLARFPHANTPPRQNRGFLRRAVNHLAAEVGIRQSSSGVPDSGVTRST
ncbi:hypothetical protein DMB66_13645 [Actinoplanes sp. ATCC 53533]|uniref:SAM-dependent methyltransferase n=1 Tax=Actinoplanes sp. ATCC 53533 TaxID=1288362 RepID=UPI000F7A76CB|nr:hypothetical protein DMB66_13645 [Actinoplanes sp. ATCC 53533]